MRQSHETSPSSDHFATKKMNVSADATAGSVWDCFLQWDSGLCKINFKGKSKVTPSLTGLSCVLTSIQEQVQVGLLSPLRLFLSNVQVSVTMAVTRSP